MPEPRYRMKRISTDLGTFLRARKTHFDAIVIGSGYGGGVSALRLAQSGRSVLVIERGRELLPGAYPDTAEKATKEVQISTAQAGPLVPGANGLFDIRVHDDMSVVVGCGLGGTSLINAGVSLKPDPRVMKDARWPQALADPEVLAPFFEKARQELGAAPLPKRYTPNKLKALEVSAQGMGLRSERPPINVTFKDRTDPLTKVFQPACNMCGDCVSGCNYGSKNTVLMNYLPRAYRAGASFVTETRTTHISQEDPGNGPWQVHVENLHGFAQALEAAREKARETGTEAEDIAPPKMVLTADIVVLAAGSLGSTEILMRSRKEGLKTSDQLGHKFSGNGDVLGFGFDAFWNNKENGGKDPQLPIYGIGAGANLPDVPEYRPGPCITGVIRVDMNETDYTKGMVIEEGVVPGAIGLGMTLGLFMQQALNGDFTRFPDVEQRLRAAQAVGDIFTGSKRGRAEAEEGDAPPEPGSGAMGAFARLAYEGAASETQTFLVMSHDKGDGRLELSEETGCITVNWPGVGEQENYVNVNAKLEAASDSIWANYLPNPLWRPRFGRKLVTVHPVGGCAMGQGPSAGVVDHACRVFTGRGADVHDGLYVCDGAVVPSSLGINPLLTITALAERAMDILVTTRPFERSVNPARQVEVEEFALTEVPLRAVAHELGPLEILIKLFKGWEDGIARGDFAKVRGEIVEEIKKRFEAKGETDRWASFKKRLSMVLLNLGLTDAELTYDIAPALSYVRGVVETVDQHIKKGEHLEAAEYLEEVCGDFSPDLAFSETMHGHVCAPHPEHAPALSNRFEVAARYGKAQGQSLRADLNIVAHSLKELTEDEAHEANLSGEIICPHLSDAPLKIGEGATFNLLIAEKGEVETWKMIYRARISNDDHAYFFEGTKTLARRPGSDWWTDLTTLFVDIYEGDDQGGEKVAMGIIRLGVQDLLKQMSTVTSRFEKQDENTILTTLAADAVLWGDLRQDLADVSKRQKLLRKLIAMLSATRDSTLTEKISLYFMTKFAGFFGMLVFRAYGEMLAYLYNFPGRARLEGKVTELPRLERAKLRYLDVHSEGFWLPNDRERTLRLTRYDGRKDKFAMNRTVVLAPGFATRAASFAMETTEKNLVDCLCEAGYDVWLLDYRSSPLLQSSLKPFTLDDIATKDWPMAVEFIRKKAGVHDMQAVVHCMGSMTHLMALLNGMEGIRSVVSSQLTLHPVTNWFNKFKADTYVARMLRDGLPSNLLPMADALAPNKAVADLMRGLPSIDANSIVEEDSEEPGKFLQDQVINMLTWEVPFPNGSPCYSPTCHRIFGIYGPVFDHKQLNEETHNAIQTVFGAVSTRPFQHIAEVVRQGIAVDAKGRNVYLEHYQNLRLPITFLAGALNQEFMPDTSLRTLDWLKRVNNEPQYRDFYKRLVWPDYAHMDFFLGKKAHLEVYPDIIAALKEHDRLLGR